MITKNDIIADMHTHTIFSEHAYSTMEENIQYALKNNLKYIAITDHYYNDGTSIHKKNETTRIEYMENNINPYLNKIQIIGSAEFNLNQEIYDFEKISKLKWRPIGLHSWFIDIPNSSLETIYEKFNDATKDNKHNCFVHIERELHKLENKKYANDYCGKDIQLWLKSICDLAKKKDIYLELNESSIISNECGGIDRIKYWLKYAKENKNLISLGSDSHFCRRVGNFTNAIELLNEIDYPKELILNCNEDIIKML